MKLSIIVPVYNMVADGKLENCLNSLLKQELDDYEIIAVDDKSTDNSLQILSHYSNLYPSKLRVIASPENKRQGGAKNLGLDVATGEWIGFVDSDDWVSKNMFSTLLQKAADTNADVVGCNYLITNQIGLESGYSETNTAEGQTGILGDEQRKKIILNPGSMVIKIYKRSLFEENHIRFPEKMFYEDNAISCLPLLHATHYEHIDTPLYFYYQHADSTVHHVSLAKCEDRIKASHIFIEECRKRGFYDKYASEIEYKVFELGYRNTLFSHLQTSRIPNIKFVVKMQKYINTTIPNFSTNIYFKQYMDAENQKLAQMHSKNWILFLIYYMLLRTYRRIRYGKK